MRGANEMSNPNRKFQTLTQAVQETEEKMCLRCVPQILTPFTLEDAQKKSCKCGEYCGYQFCNGPGPAYPLPPEIEEEFYMDGPLGYGPEDEYDREADYWSWR